MPGGPTHFSRPDLEKFPGLKLGYEAARRGGTLPAVLNAANEMAVGAFLEGHLRFVDIPRVVENTMAAHQIQPLEKVEQVLRVNRWARDFARSLVNRGF